MRTMGWGILLFTMLFWERSLFAQVVVRFGEQDASPGDTVLVEINVSDLSGLDVECFQFDLFFNATVLHPVAVSLAGTIASIWGTAFYNDAVPGKLKVGAFGLTPLEGSGALVFIRFQISGQVGEMSQMSIRNFLFNNGSPKVMVHNGYVVVKKSVRLNISSNRLNTRVYIDGNSYPMPVSTRVFVGTSHVVRVDSIQYLSNTVRYVFQSWQDGGTVSRTITLDSTDLYLKANFVRQFYLTTNAKWGVPSGEGWYNENAIAKFSIPKYNSMTDSVRYQFVGWKGDVKTTNPTDSVRMDTSKTIQAEFQEEDFLFISYSAKNLGMTIPKYPGIWVKKGETLTPTAYPKKGVEFLGWSGDICSAQNPLPVSIRHPLHITANFGYLTPVELAYFRAEYWGENEIRLHWQTKVEKNNYGFFLQRKNSKKSYKNIGFLKGRTSSILPQDYFFEDKNIMPGKYVYRLKQVDTNGKIFYLDSLTITVKNRNDANILENYPNPFHTGTHIILNLPKEDMVDLAIFNMLGQEIYHWKNKEKLMGRFAFYWNGTNYIGQRVPDGVYIVRMTTSSKIISHKLIIINGRENWK